MKKKNAKYTLDGKIYINILDFCKCHGKVGDRYVLECDVPGCDTLYYLYDGENETIQTEDKVERLFYLADAKDTVRDEVVRFEKKISRSKKWRKYKIRIDEKLYCCRYEWDAFNSLNYFLEYEDNSNRKVVSYQESASMDVMRENLLAITRHHSSESDDVKALERDTEDVTKSPLYIAASKIKDSKFSDEGKKLMALTRQAYARSTEEDAALLTAEFKDRVLPALPQQFNRDYVVDHYSIDVNMLKRSGYRICPNEPDDEPGFTEEKWMLNPAELEIIRCAPVGSGSISFREYLEMFDTPNMRKLFHTSDISWFDGRTLNSYTEYEASERVKEIILSLFDKINDKWIMSKPWFDDEVVPDISSDGGEKRFRRIVKEGDMRTEDDVEGYLFWLNY